MRNSSNSIRESGWTVEAHAREVLKNAVKALAEFKREFRLDLTPSLLAELYVALALNLALAGRRNQPGFDLLDDNGRRYQVKERDPETQNVDTNSFDFDYLVLVNLADDYSLLGMWKLDVASARSLFTYREKFRKYQATQKTIKEKAEKIEFGA